MIKKILFVSLLGACALVSAQNSEDVVISQSASKFIIIPSVGYGFRTASLASNLSKSEEDYLKKLKNGVTFDIGAFYNVKNNWGLGLKYSQFNSSADGVVTVRDVNGKEMTGSVSTKDQISFFGAAFIYNNFNENTKHKLYYDLALGVISYNSKTGNTEIKGSNFGLDADIAYQYAVTNKIYIGPKIGYTVGTLTSIKINGQNLNLNDEKEGLSRVNLSLSATFRF